MFHVADRVQLIGLDFGTTTSSAVVALASLRRTATGRMELDALEETFRSEMVFTPTLGDDRIDLDLVEQLLDAWLDAGQIDRAALFGGGALLTGLTAQKENAAGLIGLIRRRLGQSLVATADDPCLESWLSFMGSSASLSRQHPDKPLVNLDIGGGTTNLALGRNGQVERTGCQFLGARHVQVIPGSYRIVKLSRYAMALFAHLGIGKGPGDCLVDAEVDAFLDLCTAILESVCRGEQHPMLDGVEQVRLEMSADAIEPAFTFSGGVGELIYRHLQGSPWPPTTQFGDLGIDWARRLARSPLFAPSLQQYRPQSGGRATVYGLLRHATEISGSTLFMPAPGILPLADVPIFGRVEPDDSEDRLRDLLRLVQRSSRGGCVQVRVGSERAAGVAELGRRLTRILDEIAFPPDRPFVILVQENVGKILGQYLTRWGASPRQIMVIDEVALRDAQFVQIGLPRHQIVPVSFYGLGPDGHGDGS